MEMVEIKLPLELPDGDGSLVKMTKFSKVDTLAMWSDTNTLSSLNTFIKGDLKEFWPKFKLAASTSWKFIEQFKDLYIAYQ